MERRGVVRPRTIENPHRNGRLSPTMDARRGVVGILLRGEALTHGSAVPERDCTTEMSELLIKPLTVTSSRKLLLVTC
jgi:hypothetical protein